MKETTVKKNILSGLGLCLAIAIPAWLLGKQMPIIGAPVFAIIMGIIITSIFPTLSTKVQLKPGIQFTSKKILQYAIILLGFEMNLYHILEVGGQSLWIMIFTLSSAFIVAFLVGRALKINSNTVLLIGVGTAICGGSAIAATAPVIQAKDEEVAHAISTIFLFNILAVFLFPVVGRTLGLSDLGFGMWAGTAVNDTSSVVAAATSWSNYVKNDTALAFATIVKLTRTLMIVPITLILAIYTSKKMQKKEADGTASSFSFMKVFPWFVIGFVFTAVLNTFLPIPENITSFLGQLGKFMIVMAMSAIGLNTHLKKLLANGIKPIVLGICCWASVSVVSLVVQAFMKQL